MGLYQNICQLIKFHLVCSSHALPSDIKNPSLVLTTHGIRLMYPEFIAETHDRTDTNFIVLLRMHFRDLKVL